MEELLEPVYLALNTSDFGKTEKEIEEEEKKFREMEEEEKKFQVDYEKSRLLGLLDSEWREDHETKLHISDDDLLLVCETMKKEQILEILTREHRRSLRWKESLRITRETMELPWYSRCSFYIVIANVVLFLLLSIFIILFALCASELKPEPAKTIPCEVWNRTLCNFDDAVKSLNSFGCSKAMDMLHSLLLERASTCWYDKALIYPRRSLVIPTY